MVKRRRSTPRWLRERRRIVLLTRARAALDGNHRYYRLHEQIDEWIG